MAPSEPDLQIDVATGPSSSFAGLRRVIRALTDSGATFEDLQRRYPGEWEFLGDRRQGGDPPSLLANIAISASERRLHRESEHTFRVLCVGAAALCRGSEQVQQRLVLRGVGRTDLSTLRGLIRAREYQRATGVGSICVPVRDAVRIARPGTDAGDFQDDRLRCLRLIGLPVGPGDLAPVAAPDHAVPEAGNREDELFLVASDPRQPPADRLRAVVEYGHVALGTSNWEGVALLAAGCIPLVSKLTRSDVAVLAGSIVPEKLQSFEVEPEMLRHPADIRAHLLKLLGIQATFRGLQDEAVGFFRAMRDTQEPLSPELRAQSHLFAALTLTKRKQMITAAVAEIDGGFAAVAERAGECASVRRERGWMHNLLALTLVMRRDPVSALRQEKAAWACLEGLVDPSSVHLRVNLISNISVLQERTGRLGPALRTWERFADSGFGADDNFVKHYQYRAGGLSFAVERASDGEAMLQRSLDCCRALTDDFHEFEIAAELGTCALGQRRADAAETFFHQASTAANRLGDPFRMAQAQVGAQLAAGRRPDPAIGELALRSATNAGRAEALAKSLSQGGTADDPTVLPAVRTKLNRPFDLVNF